MSSSKKDDVVPVKVESEKVDDQKSKKETVGFKDTDEVEKGVGFKDKEEVERGVGMKDFKEVDGVVLWKGRPIHECDPDEVFKFTTSEEELYADGTELSSEATFTWSRPGYRGYKYCHMNEDGDYVKYVEADGTEVLYSGSLDSDSAWNKQWCKRVKREVTSSDSDEVSSHPRAKKPKSDAK